MARKILAISNSSQPNNSIHRFKKFNPATCFSLSLSLSVSVSPSLLKHLKLSTR